MKRAPRSVAHARDTDDRANNHNHQQQPKCPFLAGFHRRPTNIDRWLPRGRAPSHCGPKPPNRRECRFHFGNMSQHRRQVQRDRPRIGHPLKNGPFSGPYAIIHGIECSVFQQRHRYPARRCPRQRGSRRFAAGLRGGLIFDTRRWLGGLAFIHGRFAGSTFAVDSQAPASTANGFS